MNNVNARINKHAPPKRNSSPSTQGKPVFINIASDESCVGYKTAPNTSTTNPIMAYAVLKKKNLFHHFKTPQQHLFNKKLTDQWYYHVHELIR